MHNRMDKRYQVFVSSTYADLQEERQAVIRALMEMDCIPAGMELFPATDEEQWQFIKRVIDDCDYYVLIIGGRYGSLTAAGISYTEKEYDYATSLGLKILAFIHGQPDEIPVGKSDVEPALREKLGAFRSRVAENRLVRFWRNAKELPGLVAVSLSKTIKDYPAVGWVRASNPGGRPPLGDLPEARGQNRASRKVAAEADSHTRPATTSLASLDDPYEVTLVWSYTDVYRTHERTGKVTATWAEMFASIAPDLLEHPTDQAVKLNLGSSLFRKLQASSRTSVEVLHDDFQTIRVQLCALDLVKVHYSKSTRGNMLLFWSLTKTGQRLMTELRTVKRASQTPESSEG